MKIVQLLFEKNKIIIPVDAEIDTMYAGEKGFVISIFTVDETWQNITGFPNYVAFVYDEKGEPKVVCIANEYSEIVNYWYDNIEDPWENL